MIPRMSGPNNGGRLRNRLSRTPLISPVISIIPRAKMGPFTHAGLRLMSLVRSSMISMGRNKWKSKNHKQTQSAAINISLANVPTGGHAKKSFIWSMVVGS